MTKVDDGEHCTTNLNEIVHFWKDGETKISVLARCHEAPLTLTFDSKAKRNSYFDALVTAVGNQP